MTSTNLIEGPPDFQDSILLTRAVHLDIRSSYPRFVVCGKSDEPVYLDTRLAELTSLSHKFDSR